MIINLLFFFRSVYADKLCERLERSDITMNLEPEVIFTRHKVSLRLAQAAAARRQHNFPVAFKLLKDTHKVGTTIICSMYIPPHTVCHLYC